MDSTMMADTRWRLSQASTSQLLELLWQIWDLLNRKFRFADGPIRGPHFFFSYRWRSPAALGNVGSRLRVWVGSRLTLAVVLVILTSCHTAAAFHVMLLLQ